MNSISIYYPQTLTKKIDKQIASLTNTDKEKLKQTISLLREGKQQNDHRFKNLPADYVWISYFGGSKGGRIIYIKPDKDIIIWGVGPDHDIEKAADNCFDGKKYELDIINGELVDVTYLYPTEAEFKEKAENTFIFAENLSDSILEKMGLDDYLIRQVRKSNKVSIWDLKNIPDYRKFEIVQLAQTGVTYQAKDDAHLERFIMGDASRLLVHLDDYQIDIINYNSGKPLLIRGETGTGKTTILIYKAIFFAEENPDKDVILFTYNISLANLIKEAIADYSENKIHNLRVDAFFEWYQEALDVYEQPYQLLEKKGKSLFYDILLDCYDEKEMKSLGYDKQKSFNYFLKTEIENVIQDYLLEDEDEYLRFQRIGREKQLGKNQRSTVWDIYQRFLSKIQEQGLDTYKSLLQKFIAIHNDRDEDNSLRYDAIFLDEAQDMPPSVVKAISLLKKTSDSLIWIAGDYKQSIYRNSFRWSDVALPFYGSNVKILRKNYRNSKQILDAAHNMLKSFIKDAEKPDHCGREGVDIKYYKYKGKEKFKVVKGIIDYFHFNEGVDLSDIAVFTPARVDSIAKSFDDLEIVYEDVRNPSSSNEDSVKLSTLHSAKGLEFRVVIIIDTQSKLLYKNNEDNPLLREEKAKLLYVGMTRAFNACCFLLNEERENGVILDKVINPDRVVRVR